MLRWAAATLLMTERNFRKAMGDRGRWMLKAALDRKSVLVQEEVAWGKRVIESAGCW